MATMGQRFVVLTLRFLVLLFFAASSAFAAPLAGSVISNTAQVTFFDTDSGFNSKHTSNTVRVFVQALEALTLTSDNFVSRPTGGLVSLPHRLSNTGNSTSTYALSYSNLSGDDFDLQNLNLVWDKNGNGIADPGEPAIANGANFGPLAPGQFADLVVSGNVPSSLAVNRVARIGISAKTVLQSVSAQNTDTITIANGAQFQVVKSASNLSPNQGDTVSFTLTASNDGNLPATGFPVLVDGALESLILLRDAIPANTTFSSFGPVGTAKALYHVQGQANSSYSSSPPTDLRQVDVVAFGFAAPIVSGQSISRRIDVKINSKASGTVFNTASLLFIDGVSSLPVTADSNQVSLVLPIQPPSISLYRDAAYSVRAGVLHAGSPFYVAAYAAQCNINPLLAETKEITVSSLLTGDTEVFLAKETGPNTGEFHIEPQVTTSDATLTPVKQGDGILSVKPNDRVTVSLTGCGAVLLEAKVLVDPFGVVFDSKTNALIVGAVVTLIDISGAGNGGRPGQPATVLAVDGVSLAPSTITTGADGRYQFPLVLPSVYGLRVVPPPSYGFPSVLTPNLLPLDRVIDTQGSYGGQFSITAFSAPVNIDIPLDASALGGLLIEKTVSRKTVEMGEYVDYSIKIKNVSGQLLGRIRVTDRLPAGFAYVPNTARLDAGTKRLDGSALPEPEGGVGPVLVFNTGSIEDQSVIVLSYRVRVGPGALQGDGINRARATSAAPLTKISNESSAIVQVLPGVFTDRGFIIGTVYADCNNNRERDDAEPGIPGVRLFLEDGTSVTTDAQGKYSLYGLRPKTHVLKLDVTSLPASAGKLALLANRNAGDAGSRFADLKNGELHKADFAVMGCSPELRQAIQLRAVIADGTDKAVEQAQASQLAVDTRSNPTSSSTSNPKAQPASGVIGLAGAGLSISALPGAAANANTVPALRTTTLALSDEQIAVLDNSLAIVSPVSNQILGYAQTSVTVKGALTATLTLRVNGAEVSASRIGKLSQLESTGMQVAQYIGVELKPGKNTLELVQAAADGRSSDTRSISITAPGAFARLRLTAPQTAVPADGRSVVRVTLEALDADDVPVTARIPVTLDSNLGQWKTRDLNPDEPGTQIFIDGGSVVLELESPAQAGDALLRAAAGSVSTQTSLRFSPDLRPLIAAGVVEGVLNLRHLDSRALQPTRAQDGFEQELRQMADNFDNGRGSVGGRAALFLKGKVQGDYLLTLAYDSDKDAKERLFRDIQPGEFYPVYGDASVKSFDAQSTGRLYVRVDKDRSHVLYGDFNTQTPPLAAGTTTAGDERRLGLYARSLTGAQGHFETQDGRGRLTSFASRNNSSQVVDEQAARGVSGPFVLPKLPVVENSEKVEIITRDRNQLATVLKVQPLTRFVDYEIDSLTGQILLKGPLPSLDVNFNPNSLRVTYEVEQGGNAFWVGGIEASYQLGSVTVGGALVRDNDPLKPLTIQSVGLTAKMTERTTVVAEAAQTQTPLSTQTRGLASRFEIRHEGDLFKAQAQVTKADAGFDNPSATAAKGRQDVNAKASYKLTDAALVKAEYVRSEDTNTQATNEGLKVGVDVAINDKLRGEFGLRKSRVAREPATTATMPTTPTTGAIAIAPQAGVSALAKLTGQIPGHPQASAFVEYEQDIENAGRRTAAVGGEYRLENGARLYGRHEFISSLGNQYGLNDAQQRNATVFGVQSDAAKDLNAFSEYRLRNALDGREAEVAVGLRNRWQLSEGVRLSAGYEHVRSLNGAVAADSTAVIGGLEYTGSPDWKGAARLELRDSATTKTILNTVGAAYKLDDAWTALTKNIWSSTKTHGGADKTEDWLQLGLAYRGTGANRYNGLLRAEYRYDHTDEPTAPDTQRKVAIVSGHINYQANGQFLVSGRAAAKWATDRSAGLDSSYTTQLLSARATYDLSAKWDVGLNAAVLLGGNGRARQHGLGAELGYLLADNLWVSLGYNLFGFSDKDLTGQDYTNKGVYLRLRWKFDENLFQGLSK